MNERELTNIHWLDMLSKEVLERFPLDILKDLIKADIEWHEKRLVFLKEKLGLIEKGLNFGAKTIKELTEKTFISTSDLEKLPWKPFSSGNGSWIFSNLDNEIAKTLVELLKKYGGKIEIGNYVYRFSGENNRFISRYPKR